MAKKTNPKLIGAFVIGAIALTIVGVLAFGGSQLLEKKIRAVLFFEGQSLGGLEIGSPVTFRGIKIGSVSSIVIEYDVLKAVMHIPVYIELDPGRISIVSGERRSENIVELIEKGLRAQLEVQSLVTGQAIIDFDFHPDVPAALVGLVPGVVELPTIPSEMNVMKADIASVLQKISKLPLEEISAQLIEAMKTANETLQGARAVVKTSDQMVANLNAQIQPLSDSLKGTASQADMTLKEAQSRLELRPGEPLQTLNETLAEARKVVTEVDGSLPQLFSAAGQTLSTVTGAMDQAAVTLKTAQRSIAPDSPLYFELNTTLRELQTAATAIRVFAEYIQRNPNALLIGKQ